MAALVTTTYGLGSAVYDQLAAGLTSAVKAAPGFRTHAAYPVDGGFAVTDHKVFFESAVKPNIPAGVPFDVQVTELHNTIDR